MTTATIQVRAALSQDWEEDADDGGSIFAIHMGPEGNEARWQVTVLTGGFASHSARIEAVYDGMSDPDAWIDCDDVARVATLAGRCLDASMFTREQCNAWWSEHVGYRPDDEPGADAIVYSTERFRWDVACMILMHAQTPAEQDERERLFGNDESDNG